MYILYHRNLYNGTPKLVIALPQNLVTQMIQHFLDDNMFDARLGIHKVLNKLDRNFIGQLYIKT